MTAPSQTPEAAGLVPCPFCGGDMINTRSQEMTEGPAYYWHKCETCGAESEGDYGEDVAVTAWNRRAAPASPLPGGVDRNALIDVIAEAAGWGVSSGYIKAERTADAVMAHLGLPAAPTGDAT